MNVYSSHTHGGSLIVFRQHLLGGEFNEGGWGCAEEGLKVMNGLKLCAMFFYNHIPGFFD